MVLMRLALLLALLGLPTLALAAADPPTARELLTGDRACVLINATILPMTGTRTTGRIDHGWIQLSDEGTITALGPMSRQPRIGLPTLDCTGLTITPGLIDADTVLGLSGHPVIGITQDQNDSSERNLAALRVIDGIHPADKAIPRVRAAGITTVYVSPGDNSLINGQGALIKLRDRGSVEGLILKAPAALQANLGESPKRTWGSRGGPQTRMGTAAVLRMEFIAGQNWLKAQEKHQRDLAKHEAKVVAGTAVDDEGIPELPPSPPDRDLRKEALGLALQGEIPVIFGAHRQDDILTALRIASEFNLRGIILYGTSAWQVLPELQTSGVPILVGPIRTGPNAMETLAARIDNAALIADARIPFAIQTGDALGVRGLLHDAAWAVAGGLTPDEALLSVTRYPAEIFGVSDRIGSLAPGKDADLVLWTGDPLASTTTARYVVIEGHLVNDGMEFPPFPDGRGW